MKSRFPSQTALAGIALAALSTFACSSSESDTAPVDGAQAQGTPPAKTATGGEPFHGMLQYRAKDAKLALVRPTLVPADEAQMAGGVRVIGVSVNGESRAYPLYLLNNHQIVNDRVGGQPIAASW